MRQLLVSWLFVAVVSDAAGTALAQTSAGPQPPPLSPSWLEPPRPTTPPSATPAPAPAAPIVADPAPDQVASDSDAPSGAPADQPTARARLALPGYYGPVGLLRVSAAEVGAAGQLRLGFTGEYFSADSFLVEHDENRRFGGSFVLGYTPIEHLELFAAVLGSSNRNRRQCTNGVCTSEPGRTDPEVIRSLGDIVLGGKGAWSSAPGSPLSLGAQAGVRLVSSSAGLSLEPSATSVFVDALATFDVARTPSALPLAGHVNLGFYVDNSDEVAPNARTPRPSYLVSSFAYGIGRSRVRAAVGAEGRAALGEHVRLVPFAEYHWEYVTAGADDRFRDFLPPACATGAAAAGQQACADDRSQQWATFGARVQGTSGLALLAAVDLGLDSVGFPYGPPVAPYQIVFGVAAPIETSPRAAQVVTRTVVVEKPVARASAEGRVAGTVKNARTNAPVPDAIVAVVGRPRARVATDDDGGFLSGPLPPGDVELEVGAAGFERGRARASIAAGQIARVDVALAPKVVAEAPPAAEQAKVHGRLTTTKGRPLVGAIVRFVGPTTVEAKTDATGAYALALPPGNYAAHAEAGTAFAKDIKASFPPGEDHDLSFSLRPRPATPSVQLAGDRITLRRPIVWKAGPPGAPLELTPASEQVLDEVADLLSRDRTIRTLTIEAHWDDSLDAPKAADVTKRQAQIVVDYLVAGGVAPERLQAQGLGGEHPLVPNLGPANRARNRRIELRVTRESRL